MSAQREREKARSTKSLKVMVKYIHNITQNESDNSRKQSPKSGGSRTSGIKATTLPDDYQPTCDLEKPSSAASQTDLAAVDR